MAAHLLVAAGIFLSRIFGLIRQRVLAHYLGLSAGADAITAAFRIPNLLQNLLGEGVLSASFIPVYSRLRSEGREADADKVANAVFGLLALVTAGIVLAGMLLAGPLTDLIAPGFQGAKRDLTARLVRLLFPGAGLLVLSAWCLGVLNSHRRFFLSYSAPVVWNLAIIITLIVAGNTGTEEGPAVAAAVGSVIGSALQFGVQLPWVLRLLHRFRPTVDHRTPEVRVVLRNFTPAFIGRGVTQLSAFIDTMIASLLGQGPVAALSMAQVLYTLPVSLFGMSVSAAELPAMSSSTGTDEEVATALRQRLSAGLERVAYYVIPSAVAFLAFGRVLAAGLFQTGRFTAEDSRLVWAILAGSAVGLLPATQGRLYSSAFYALHDTRSPLRFALIRVVVATSLGLACALVLPPALGLSPVWGAAGLTLAAGLSAWLEFGLLRRRMDQQIGRTRVPWTALTKLWIAAAGSASVALAAQFALGARGPVPLVLIVAGVFGASYLALTFLLSVPEARGLLGRLSSRRA